jgi:carbonic anhydrase
LPIIQTQSPLAKHGRERIVHRRKALKMFAGLELCPLCTPACFGADHHWGYTGDAGPDKWGGLDAADAACSGGDQQSPIDITDAISARQPPLRIDWSNRPDTIVNNGHTIQLAFAQGSALSLGNQMYVLRQLHFHHPSEHLVDGKRFAMEAHFVHEAADGLAVVGVLMIPGKPNAAFKKIIATMPPEEGPPTSADQAVDPSRLLPAQRAYFHYKGSLTTPPCSQTVDWIVLSHPIEVDEGDIARFAELYPMNARPIQTRDRRFILSSGSQRWRAQFERRRPASPAKSRRRARCRENQTIFANRRRALPIPTSGICRHNQLCSWIRH